VPITALAFDVSGDHIAASGYHEVTIWKSDSGALSRRIGNVAQRTFDLAFSPDGRWLACASGTPGKVGEVKLFNATNGQLAKVLATIADAELCLAFSPDGRKLAAGGADNAIRIWDLNEEKPPLVIEQHADWILSLAFSPNSTRLLSGSRDKSARLFDTETGALDETYTGHSDFVTAVAWVDDKSVISASRTRNAHRWNVKDTKKAAEFSGWEGDPTRLLVFGTNLFSASLDGKVRQQSLESKEKARELGRHRDAIHSLALHSHSKRLASGSHDGEVRILNVDDGKLLLKFSASPGYTPKLSRVE
jgi:WD40 repeat protein